MRLVSIIFMVVFVEVGLFAGVRLEKHHGFARYSTTKQ